MGVSRFSEQFKADAVRLLKSSTKPIGEVAKIVGVTTKTLRAWATQMDIDAGEGPDGALTTAEKQELSTLRRENRELRRERDFLQQAAAYFAKANK
jgi:transposase